ncbi:MAG: cysteine--tRNA ligase [Patescibacteria group bacterium]
MSLHLHNTLTGKKEKFTSIRLKKVSMYNCGPTVYNYAHIGNLRAYVFVDVLRRTLEYSGFEVKQVMNITDVGHLTSDANDGDDKMVKALKRENKPFTLEAMREVADFYTMAFIEDLKALNCEIPHEMPKASDHIEEDIEIIKILEKKGIAYKTKDGIYYDISKYPEYGKLGNINLEGQLAGARVEVNSEKRSAADFVLWKFSDTEIGWGSPFGSGFPGWHIECSAMAYKYLGQPFDIHTGGIDHIPVHHNNEIAQSESAYDAPLAHYWLHNEHVNISSGKMAKSGDNFFTLKSLREKGISPLAYRYFLLLANYRTPIAFQEEIVKKVGGTSLERVYRALSELPDGGKINAEYAERFIEAINNDLNTAEGLSLVYKVLDDKIIASADKLATILDFDRVLGLDLEKGRHTFPKGVAEPVPESVLSLIALRNEARANKDWKKSDGLRAQIEMAGFLVEDSDSITKIKLKG